MDEQGRIDVPAAGGAGRNNGDKWEIETEWQLVRYLRKLKYLTSYVCSRTTSLPIREDGHV